MSRSDLLGTAALPASIAAQAKILKRVHRVTVHAEELMSCGFDPTKPDEFARILRPLMLAKGVPERFLHEGVDCRIMDSSEDGKFTLEFE